jgi:hypothetical protein
MKEPSPAKAALASVMPAVALAFGLVFVDRAIAEAKSRIDELVDRVQALDSSVSHRLASLAHQPDPEPGTVELEVLEGDDDTG